MEILTDAFFLIGSLMGIAAFARTTVEALKSRNLRCWERIRSVISESDLKSLEFQIRRISDELLTSLGRLVEEIREQHENLVFGPVLRKRIEDHLGRFCDLYDELRQLVQSPWWHPVSEELDGGKRVFSIDFNKKAFFDEELRPELNYVQHLELAADIAIKMRLEYRAVATLVGLDILEIPRADTLVKRAQAPLRNSTEK